MLCGRVGKAGRRVLCNQSEFQGNSVKGGIFVRMCDELRASAADAGHDPGETVNRARAIRTYEELRGVALEMGYCPEEAVKRARTFAACMTESSTGEAVRLVAQKMRKGLPVSMDNRPGRDLLVGGEGV